MENKENKEKTKLSGEQKQKLKKYGVFGIMGLIFIGCMLAIFTPSADKKAGQEQTAGFNAEIPMPKEAGLIGDKRDAYEQEKTQQKQNERIRSLEDFSAMTGGVSQNPSDDLILLDDEPLTEKRGNITSGVQTATSVQNSVNAYNDINQTLGNFYETPQTDLEKEWLIQELEELKMRLDETDNRKNAVDDQLALMEKSFQMAAKYIPGISTTDTESVENVNSSVIEKSMVLPVGLANTQTVSSLHQNLSDADFVETFSRPRNMGFFTASGEISSGQKNTISACVHTDQTVLNGQTVRFRLLEDIRVGKKIIPHNTLLSGMAKIQGERLDVSVTSIECGGQIVPVELVVYDMDGQRGIFIPDLQELNAAKEIVANMGTSAGTNISLTSDAGKQFVADMGRNAIQGISQYTAKKLREVKVKIKSGYGIYLVSEDLLKAENSKMLANK